MKGHIRPRGPKTWAIKVDIGRDPATGKRRTKWYTVHGAKRDAQRELARILHEINTGQHVEPTRLTVAEYLREWLADYAKPNVSRKTCERYTGIVEKDLIPALGHHRLTKLAPLHIQTYYSDALKQGRKDGRGGLSAQTVKHHHRLLSQALKRAVRLQLLFRNPCDAVDPPRPQRREMKILDQDESKRLLKAAKGERIYMPILLAITTGMRRGEVLALKWADMNLETGSLSVTHTLEQTAEGLHFKTPKTTRSRRTITLVPSTVEIIRRHKVAQSEAKLRVGPAYDDQNLVCATELGAPMVPNEVSRAFGKLIRSLDLDIRFHDLRHTHISHLLALNIHPKVVSERAGHASVAITLDVYSHVMPGMQEDAAKKLDAVFRSALEE